MTGERCSKLVIQLLNSVCWILVFSVWRSGWFFFAHGCCRIETCERRNWEELCVPSDETRQESLRGTFPSEKALRARQLWSSSSGGGHEFGGAPLVVVRSNECLWCRSLFSSVGAALQHVREAYEVGHCRVEGRGRGRAREGGEEGEDSQMASGDER